MHCDISKLICIDWLKVSIWVQVLAGIFKNNHSFNLCLILLPTVNWYKRVWVPLRVMISVWFWSGFLVNLRALLFCYKLFWNDRSVREDTASQSVTEDVELTRVFPDRVDFHLVTLWWQCSVLMTLEWENKYGQIVPRVLVCTTISVLFFLSSVECHETLPTKHTTRAFCLYWVLSW